MQYWKLESDEPLYKNKFGDVNIHRFKVVTDQQQQVGKVLNALVDEQQSVSLHVETGPWLSPEWIVVPLGEYQLQPQQRTLRLLSSSASAQVSQTNGHNSHQPEAAHRAVVPSHLPPAQQPSAQQPPAGQPACQSLDRSADQRSVHQDSPERSRSAPPEARPVGAALGRAVPETPTPAAAMARTRGRVTDDSVMDDGETIRLLEERLRVERHRRKVGEVVVHKVVDTQMIQVPVRRERLVVEQISPERKQLATIDLGQVSGAIASQTFNQTSSQALGQSPEPIQVEPAVQHLDLAQNGSTQAATLASTQQFLAQLAQRPQLAKAKLRLVFDDPELQAYYQRWLNQG
ncbi:MAG: DUF2382 domain-containing protein [Elainella sp.]